MDLLTVILPVSATAAGTYYLPVPRRCSLLGVRGAVNADIGDALDFSFSKGATSVATLTFGSGFAAGAVATGAMDATNGQEIFELTDPIKVSVPQGGVAGDVVLTLEIDPFLSGVPGA